MLTKEQNEALRGLLPRDVVRTRRAGKDTVSYIPGWYAIGAANRIFGFDGWSYRVLETDNIHTGTLPNGNVVGVYRATVELKVGDVVRQDVGLDSYDVPPSAILTGIDKAQKGAVTDALKRALRTFGDAFGLSLYDKQGCMLGFRAEAEEFLEQIDALQSQAEAETWWRSRRDAISAFDQDEQDEVQARFTARRYELSRGIPAPQQASPAASAPPPAAAPPVAAAPQDPTPAEAAPVSPPQAVFASPKPVTPPAPRSPTTSPRVSSVAAAIVAIGAARTLEEVRTIPKALNVAALNVVDRADLNAAYAQKLKELDLSAWLRYRALEAREDAAKDAVFNDSAAALGEQKITPEDHEKVVRLLGGAR